MDLYQYLQSSRTSLFRFETLQEYKVDGDSIGDDGMKEWWNFIASKIKDGVVMERVRLIIEPLTEYTKNELVVHKKSKTFGDNIKIIKEDTLSILNIKPEDFWLVDEKVVLRGIQTFLDADSFAMTFGRFEGMGRAVEQLPVNA